MSARRGNADSTLAIGGPDSWTDIGNGDGPRFVISMELKDWAGLALWLQPTLTSVHCVDSSLTTGYTYWQ